MWTAKQTPQHPRGGRERTPPTGSTPEEHHRQEGQGAKGTQGGPTPPGEGPHQATPNPAERGRPRNPDPGGERRERTDNKRETNKLETRTPVSQHYIGLYPSNQALLLHPPTTKVEAKGVQTQKGLVCRGHHVKTVPIGRLGAIYKCVWRSRGKMVKWIEMEMSITLNLGITTMKIIYKACP